MQDEDKKNRRDRDGMPYENDLTEEDTASPEAREEAAHIDPEKREDSDANDDADEFMHDRKFPKPS